MRKASVLAAGIVTALLLLLLHSGTARATELDATAEVAIGTGVLVGGYGLGAAPALTGRGNQTAAIPLIGPLVWWTTTMQRIDARVAYERANPCHGNGEPFSCVGANTSGIDRFFHITMALPYALAATGAQTAGIVLLVHGASRTDRSRGLRGEAKEHTRLGFAPTATGLRVFGTF